VVVDFRHAVGVRYEKPGLPALAIRATRACWCYPRSVSADSLAFAAAHVLPAMPDVGSPRTSSIKSNNPFDRCGVVGSAYVEVSY
jgi:hypothetical protein